MRLDLNELNGWRIPLEHLNASGLGSIDIAIGSVLHGVADIDASVVPILIKEAAS